MSMHRLRSILENNKGQALVETALVIVLLFALIFGIAEFGRAMYTKNMLNNAARAAARVAAVTPNLGSGNAATPYSMTFTKNGLCSSYAATPIKQKVCDSLFYVDKSTITATITTVPSPVVTGSGASVTVNVTVNPFFTDISRNFPIIGRNLPATLTGSASMRYEQ